MERMTAISRLNWNKKKPSKAEDLIFEKKNPNLLDLQSHFIYVG